MRERERERDRREGGRERELEREREREGVTERETPWLPWRKEDFLRNLERILVHEYSENESKRTKKTAWDDLHTLSGTGRRTKGVPLPRNGIHIVRGYLFPFGTATLRGHRSAAARLPVHDDAPTDFFVPFGSAASSSDAAPPRAALRRDRAVDAAGHWKRRKKKKTRRIHFRGNAISVSL